MEVDEHKSTESDNLPDEVELFPYQVAGHKHGKGRLGLGILKHKNGQILKPLFEDNGRAEKELSFYDSVYKNSSADPLLEELKYFLPIFYGTKNIYISGKDIKYLCLEDACGAFQNPSLLDLKIGRITYDEGASKEKIGEQKAKFLHGEASGVRIVGMKVYDEETQIYFAPDKMIFRQLTPDGVASSLKLYFTKDRFINSLLLCGFIHKLSQLKSWFSRQRKFKFIGSSILFVYEGTLSFWKEWIKNMYISDDQNASRECKKNFNDCSILKPGINGTCTLCGLDKYVCTEVLTKCNLFRIVMIDFAHVSCSEKEDTNYLFGLHNLINYLKNLLDVQTTDS
ncbi:Inositol polyphosphate multikinase like protein [Argiope bruennichi]|uniref:Kinase n=1 Tax=Argiope bruennichi TaxID=94029 RepID=A0A8T0EDF5_ARGBR|nr:Inositol polyphosphate multikinase like protein [Argiope bruennichi]